MSSSSLNPVPKTRVDHLREGAGNAVHALYGANRIEAMFPGGALIRPTPWQSASRSKVRHDYDPDVTGRLLRSPVDPERDLTDVDPRMLRSTQPSVTRAGVEHYMGRQWEQTGKTFADQHSPSNQYPVVYARHGQEMLLSGHHRAAAALLQGRPLRARRVSGDWGPPRKRSV